MPLYTDGGEPEGSGLIVGGMLVLYLLARFLNAIPPGLVVYTDMFMGILIIAVLPFIPMFSMFIWGVLAIFGNIIGGILGGVIRLAEWFDDWRVRRRWSY